MSDIYRKTALDKLSNPEQLDKAINIATPFSWLAIIAAALIIISFLIWSFFGTVVKTVEISGNIVSKDSVCAIHSNCIGSLKEIKVKTGQKVETGKTIAIVNMNGEKKEVKSDISGTITDILVAENSKVFMGTEILRVSPEINGEKIFAFYVPKGNAGYKKGMDVQLYPVGIDSQKYGYIKAHITYVDEFPADINNMAYVLGTGNIVFKQYNNAYSIIICEIEEDKSTKSGFAWSNKKGAEIEINLGTEATAKIIQERIKPIDKFLEKFKH